VVDRLISSLNLSREEFLLFKDQPVLSQKAKELDGLLHVLLTHEHVSVLVEYSEVVLVAWRLFAPQLLISLSLDIMEVHEVHALCFLNIRLNMEALDGQ
jgi:hypothetical protein